jgi:DNA integrity scanning protein DisA with diadenylate cyclase activity
MVDLKGKGLNVQYRYKKNEEVDILHKMTCWLKDIFNHDNNQIILNNTSLLECDKTIGLLSQLSNVDGAVVISRDFQIIGFGAIIELESEHEYIDMVSQCYDSGYIKCQNKSLNLFGTRHRSAAAFCKKCPGSIAVVVSQDGNVRLMHCANDTVFLWDGFVHSLFG